MRFVLFVEGETEQEVIGPFLKRWLDPQLQRKVGIQAVRFTGWAKLLRELPASTRRYLDDIDSGEVIAVIGLMDLFGPTFTFPKDAQTVAERKTWAIREIESNVKSPHFRMFFAIHEIEAWLLSQPEIFPPAIRSNLPKTAPEAVNSRTPPSAVLGTLYRKHLNRHYDKRTDGHHLFQNLDPAAAREKCPALKELQDELLSLAKKAGL